MTCTIRIRLAVLAFGCILAAAIASQSFANDNIPVNPKLLTTPPEGAVILFDGKPEQIHDNWVTRRTTDPAGWTVDADGAAAPPHDKPKHKDISSKQEFGDCYLHAEFKEPMTGHGNSGVGMQGRYEVQILNSYGKENPGVGDCGAFYSQTPPKVNASKPAGEWQTFDIFFRAPRFDADGKRSENARATVYHNGTLVQEDAEFHGPTGIQYEQYKGEVPKGPVVLQGDHDTVQFRNVWLVPAKY
jgi:hypothetical protein